MDDNFIDDEDMDDGQGLDALGGGRPFDHMDDDFLTENQFSKEGSKFSYTDADLGANSKFIKRFRVILPEEIEKMLKGDSGAGD